MDPFRSLSRLKQRRHRQEDPRDHPQVMNACVRLYADAANAKTKLENGFDLSDHDERTLKFAFDYSENCWPLISISRSTRCSTPHGGFSPVLHPGGGRHQGGTYQKILEGGVTRNGNQIPI